jgi:hypothetical protein
MSGLCFLIALPGRPLSASRTASLALQSGRPQQREATYALPRRELRCCVNDEYGKGTDANASPPEQAQRPCDWQPLEKKYDLFVPIIAVTSIVGFFAIIIYDTVRSYGLLQVDGCMPKI